jgi:hypothetical protein
VAGISGEFHHHLHCYADYLAVAVDWDQRIGRVKPFQVFVTAIND